MADSNNDVPMLAPDLAWGSDAQPGPSTLKRKRSIGTSNAQAGPSSSNSKRWYALHGDEHESVKHAKQGSSASGKTLNT